MKPFKIFLFFTVILLLVSVFRNVAFFELFEHEHNEVNRDSVLFSPNNDIIKCEIEDSDSNVIATNTFLELQENDSCLHSFFKHLKTTGDTLVRIIYYGDSQIEGDHLTYTLRKNLQERFGGAGIGYLPIEMYFNTTEHLAVITNDFEKRMVAYEQNDSLLPFGLYGRFFQPIKSSGEIRIVNRGNGNAYSKVNLLFSGEAKLRVESEETVNYTLNGKNVENLAMLINKSTSNLKLKFSDFNNFNLYGLLLDQEKGIAVDDVSFRGNLNLMLNRFDGDVFTAMGLLLNPSLIVLQFGLNVVPDIRPEYTSYRYAVERDISYLKKYLPGTSILVIGLSDIAHKVNEEMVPYSNASLILNEMRTAAKNQRVAFWDMRQAMGGEGSIINWVSEGWARSDYAHLTITGTEKIGELLSRDLMSAYDQYLTEHE